MTRLLLIIPCLVLTIMLNSCFKEDERVIPHEPGNTIVDTISLTNSYKYQVFYQLENAEPVGTLMRKDWDLAFESTPDGWHIRLNTSCFMYAASFIGQEFGILADTSGAKWLFDNSNGSEDSLAIGKWFSISVNDTITAGQLYIINRGIDELGNERGYRQLVIDSLANGTYYIRTSKMNGADQKSFVVTKNPEVNNVLLSLDHGVTTFSEPPSSSWDILFTQYTTLLYTDEGDPYPYLVTGVLLNPQFVQVAKDSINPFEQISFESVSSLSFDNNQDFIGYDWKYYDFDTGSYTVDLDKIFIIRDKKGFYYKFRFLGFYNQAGEKGFPSFEFQRL